MELSFNPILHVEDDENDVVLVQRALTTAGVSHPLQVVRNGLRATDYLLGREPFDRRTLYPLPSLILLDLDMPVMNGIEFLKWRQTQREVSRIPTIVFTSSRRDEHIAAAYEAGANGFLIKPQVFAELVDMVKAIQLFWLTHNTYAGLGMLEVGPEHSNSRANGVAIGA